MAYGTSTGTEALAQLVKSHFDVEPGIVRICTLVRERRDSGQSADAVRLLEVNRRSIPVGLQGVHFPADPSSGIHDPCIIYDITPEEYDSIEHGDLALPPGTRIGQCFERSPGES